MSKQIHESCCQHTVPPAGNCHIVTGLFCLTRKTAQTFEAHLRRCWASEVAQVPPMVNAFASSRSFSTACLTSIRT